MPATDTVKVTSPDFVDDAVMSELVGKVDRDPRMDSGCERVRVSVSHRQICRSLILVDSKRLQRRRHHEGEYGQSVRYIDPICVLGIHLVPIKSHSHVQTHTELCVYGHEELATVQAPSESFTSAGVRSDLPATSL